MIQLRAGYLRAMGQRWRKTKYTWIKFSCRKHPARSACLAGPEEPRRHTTQAFITRVQLLPCLSDSILLSAPLPKIIPHPAPATSPASLHPTPTHSSPSQPCTIHSISWISALNLQRLSGPRLRRSADHFPASLQPLTARSHILPQTRVGRESFRWDSLSQCFPCYPILPSSPGSRAPALLLLCVTVFRSHRGLDGSCTQVLSQIQAVEWR